MEASVEFPMEKAGNQGRNSVVGKHAVVAVVVGGAGGGMSSGEKVVGEGPADQALVVAG